MATQTFDIIFAGGGTAACVVASRLLSANPELKVLIIETGQHVENKPEHVQPVMYPSHLMPTATTITFHVSKPSPECGNRPLITPVGRCVGGSSSINFMMYTRANKSDYDDWEKKFSNPGWGYDSLLPYLRKPENYQVAPGLDSHGYSGPLKVSTGGARFNVADSFLDVASKYDSGRKVVDDVNNLHEADGYGRWNMWIDSETGRRSDVAHNYIYNKSFPNLTFALGKRVKRVIFEGGRATGIEYVTDGAATEDPVTFETALASKLVVLSAGTFGTPAILERSGIGRPDILAKHNIELKVDLPGVGEGFRDHNGTFIPYYASEDADTLDLFLRGVPEEVQRHVADYTAGGKGFIAHNGIDSGGKLRPNPKDLKEIGPTFEKHWKTFFEPSPDKPVLWVGTVAYFLTYPMDLPPRKLFNVACYTAYPTSVGSVHISSANANAPLDFDCAFLREPEDVAVLRWGYKRTRELARRMKQYRGEYPPAHPQFSKDSKAACVPEGTGPVPIEAPDLEYDEADNKAIEEFIRTTVQTTWHPLGTVAMKPRAQGGVVDPKLNVYGVTNLKVVDLSVAPANVGSNTYSITLALAEKAASIIAEDLRLNPVA